MISCWEKSPFGRVIIKGIQSRRTDSAIGAQYGQGGLQEVRVSAKEIAVRSRLADDEMLLLKNVKATATIAVAGVKKQFMKTENLSIGQQCSSIGYVYRYLVGRCAADWIPVRGCPG